MIQRSFGFLALGLIAVATGCTSETPKDEAGEVKAIINADAGINRRDAGTLAEASGAAVSEAVRAPDAKEFPNPKLTAVESKLVETSAESGKADASEISVAAAGKPAADPPAAFARCALCHDVAKDGPNKLGPNLHAVMGSKAGFHPGFAYSDALKSSGIVWTEANLHAWLENPRILVAGNRMSFPGLKDPAKRQEIVDYLKTLQ